MRIAVLVSLVSLVWLVLLKCPNRWFAKGQLPQPGPYARDVGRNAARPGIAAQDADMY